MNVSYSSELIQLYSNLTIYWSKLSFKVSEFLDNTLLLGISYIVPSFVTTNKISQSVLSNVVTFDTPEPPACFNCTIYLPFCLFMPCVVLIETLYNLLSLSTTKSYFWVSFNGIDNE